MRVASVNVRGLTSYDKKIALFHWAKRNNIDILCLQETFLTTSSYTACDTLWNGNTYHALTDSPHSRGATILFRKDFPYKLINFSKSQDGRRILVNFEYD